VDIISIVVLLFSVKECVPKIRVAGITIEVLEV
jgi:hypothetical protein